MLRFLRIRSLAVIESVDVELDSGFSVLTGETGAGKSILVEAIGQLLGARASADLVRTGEPQASIEALFDDHAGRELIVRREITSAGRSRSFINGALATSAALKDLSQRLVEIHGQHEHQALLDAATHLPLVDGYASLEALRTRVAAAWTELRRLRDQLDRSKMDTREKAARLELIAFQLGEIEKAAPKPGEDDDLVASKQVLANAERIQRLCEESYAVLYERDDAILAGLAGVWKRVSELSTLDTQFAPHLAARDGIKSQLEDLAFFLRGYIDSIDASPGRLQEVEDRLALLERLKRKYGPTLDDVIDAGVSLGRERALLLDAGEGSAELERSLAVAREGYLRVASELSTKRRSAALAFARELETLLAELAMARTRFEVRFSGDDASEETWSERGIDDAEFFFSPNPGEDVRPLARIASGGELSRVMLALKTLGFKAGAVVAGTSPRTLIFDEVDAGIGGRVADVVGARLQGLGAHVQVLCITHLPQIAARAGTQFHIEKNIRGSRTVTSVRQLDTDGRVEEIARMIGGEAVSETVRASARELLAAARPTKQSARRPKRAGER